MPRRLLAPLVLLAGLFVLAGGYLHLTEWLDVYRDVPSAVAGAAVVKIGFPVNVALSVVAVIALGVAFGRGARALAVTAAAILSFQLGSLGALIVSRTGSLFGWTEPVWNRAAERTRAVEIGASVLLVAVVVLAGAGSTARGSEHDGVA